MYKTDYANHTELDYDITTPRISILYDQKFSGDNGTQTNVCLINPVVSTNLRINGKKYFLKFDGYQKQIMRSTIDLNANIVNIFIVYKIDSYDTSCWLLNGICVYHDSNFHMFILASTGKWLYAPLKHLMTITF